MKQTIEMLIKRWINVLNEAQDKNKIKMTNKEKLEIIDKKLEVLYNKELSILEHLASDVQKDITQAIYNLESTKLLLEQIENNLFEVKKVD